LITEDLAHSWPEIYFPAYGWVAFEPTSGSEPIDRLQKDDTAIPNSDIEPIISKVDPFRFVLDKSPYFLSGIVLVLLACFVLLLIRRVLRSRRSAIEIIRADYHSLSNHAMRLGIQPGPSTTPYELSKLMRQRLETISHFTVGDYLFEKIDEVLPEFTEHFIANRYGVDEAKHIGKSDLNRIWKILDQHLWMAVFISRIKELKIMGGKKR
jgi:hypothetical protein